MEEVNIIVIDIDGTNNNADNTDNSVVTIVTDEMQLKRVKTKHEEQMYLTRWGLVFRSTAKMLVKS